MTHRRILMLMFIAAVVCVMGVGMGSVVPVEEWNKTFGGSSTDSGYSVQQTADGGYILAGETRSYGDINGDAWLIKTDIGGKEQWNKTFGRISNDRAQSVQQTSDGGYIIAGSSTSSDFYNDALLINTDANGNEKWNKTFSRGFQYNDEALSVQQTSDGGYVFAGTTRYYVEYPNDLIRDVWLVKTDANGKEQWNKTFEGSTGNYVQQTTDGGYIIAGGTDRYNAQLIKTDSNGQKQWNMTFEGSTAYSGQQTTDGGYIIAGGGYEGTWLIKTDSNGQKQFNVTFERRTNYEEVALSVGETTDGGYVLVGYLYDDTSLLNDGWIIKADTNGNEQWNKTFVNTEYINSVQQTKDGNYILAGSGVGICVDACLIKVSSDAEATTPVYNINTGTNYTTIQAAIDDASPGDEIHVDDGTYIENVDVYKRLALIGEGADVVTVQAADASDHVFEVTADWVNISGLTVTGATNRQGIHLYNADHCSISDNNASNNCDGIRLDSSSNNLLTDNIVNSNNRYGIILANSIDNTVTNNTANSNSNRGIWLAYSSGNILTDNTANLNDDVGVYVYGYDKNDFNNSIDTTNMINGKMVYYFFDKNRVTWDGLNAGHMTLAYCSDCTVKNGNVSNGIRLYHSSNNTLVDSTIVSDNGEGICLECSSSNNTITNNKVSNNSRGIYLSYYGDASNNNTIINNRIYDNSYGIYSSYSGSKCSSKIIGNRISNNSYGVFLEYSGSNDLTNNKIDNNNYGIYIWGMDSINNTITKNTILNNSEGIYLCDYGNLVYLNIFINNTNHNAYDTGTNQWDNGSEGNYWSDYTGTDSGRDGIGDDPYDIPGGSSVDRYPLMQPWTAAPLSGKIAFASFRDGNQEIYVMNANGSGDPINLTNCPGADDGDPTWSPDGTQIAFSSNRSGKWKTYIMNADDGSDQVCLLEGVHNAWGPAWSPDGAKIAFAGKMNPSDDFEIYTIDIQSKTLTQVTDNTCTDYHPSWSPDSHKIVFTNRDDNDEIYVADLLTGTKTRLTDAPEYDDYPEWSPDGSMIVFVSERDVNREIYSMDIASKAITRLTYDDSIDKHAQWSPDSQKIVFVSDRGGSGDLDVYVMNADGTGIACLVDWEGEETHPTWSPDQTHHDEVTLTLVGITEDTLPNNAMDVCVSGNYAYVADFTNGLVIVDISDPANPVTVGNHPSRVGDFGHTAAAIGVAVSGTYAYVANWYDDLYVIDVTDPTNPTLAATYDTGDGADKVTIYGDYVYISSQWDGVDIIDISDPTNPGFVGNYDTDDLAEDVAISGNYAYIADRSDGVIIINISDPANPSFVGSCDTPDDANSIVVAGNHAYVADAGGFVVIDVSNPVAPAIVGQYDTSSWDVWGVALSGDYVYVGDGPNGVVVLNVSDPTNLVFAGGYDTPGYAGSLEIVGDLVYVADDRLVILRTDASDAPQISVGQGAPDLAIKNHFIDAYNRNGGATLLGNPTTDVHRAWGYLVQDFPGASGYAGGIIMYNPYKNYAYYIHGAIWERYYGLGGPRATTDIEFELGPPVSDIKPYIHIEPPEVSSHGTQFRYQHFEGGALNHNIDTGEVFEIHGAIFAKWGELGYASDELGLVASDEREAAFSPIGTEGRVSDFEGGHIHWHRTGGHGGESYETHGAIDAVYCAEGGSGGRIGFPVSDEYVNPSGYPQSDFEGGYITTTDGVTYEAYEKDDTTPPTLTIEQPIHLHDNMIDLSGTAYDASGILNDKIEIMVVSDGLNYCPFSFAPYDSTLQTWSSPNIPVGYGNNVIKVSVQDNNHNIVEETTSVYLAYPDFSFVHITDAHIDNDWIDLPEGILDENGNEIEIKRYRESVSKFGGTLREVNKEKPAFVIDTGDCVEYDNRDLFKNYTETLDRFIDEDIDIYHTSGNHDRRNQLLEPTDLTNYNDIVKPTNGPKTSLNDGYDDYYFDRDDYRFIGLESGADWSQVIDLTPEGSGLKDDQMTKLREMDQNIPKIIFMHHPAINEGIDTSGIPIALNYCPEYGGNDDCIAFNRCGFIEYCTDYNVQLVLTGHTHRSYEAQVSNTIFIQTPSATKDKDEFNHGYRIIDIKDGKAVPREYTHTSTQPYWRAQTHCPVHLHAYDSQGRHTGLNASGGVETNIPDSFYIGRYNYSDPNEIETILLYNTTEEYRFEIVANLTEEEKTSSEIESFNFTVEQQTDDTRTTIAHLSVPLTENTTAILPINLTTTAYTMEIDNDGDGATDETRDPDFTETNYAPTAAIIAPETGSIYNAGEPVEFNGTGRDPEDGILTNFSLVWYSDINGAIGAGERFSTANLSCGAHRITLMVNDSTGLMSTQSIALTITNDWMPGDPNHDGNVTPADAAIALAIAATGAQNPAADVSGDGSVTSLDALMILQAAAGRIEL